MKRAAPLSMTWRLVSLWALVALVTLAGVGTYLYHSLYVQLARRDDDELLGKSRSIDHLVQEAGALATLRANRHIVLDTISGHDRLLVLITDERGGVIASNHDAMAGTAPILADTLRTTRFDRIQTLALGSAGMRYIATRPRTASGEQAMVLVARDGADRVALLASYRAQVWYAASIATVLSSLLGLLLVRSGLRPLRLMAAQTRSISAQQLERRLDLRAVPSELHEIVESFNAMLQRLHRSFEQLNQFSADLAHDLRTPLNNLMVQTQVALGKPRAVADYQSLLGSNIEEYERLARMMESMLFLARAENADVAMTRQLLDVAQELSRIADYFEGIADEAGVHIAATGSGQVWADPMLLRRALGNLLANAIRHTASPGVIELRATPAAQGMLLSVSNPGAGIAPAQLERIFDRFYRTDAARSSAAGSSGLGLAIVRSIMALHGGQATVTSVLGQRTTFSLAFPHPHAAHDGRASQRQHSQC